MDFDQFLDPGSLEPGPLRQRTYFKCRYCRKRKIKVSESTANAEESYCSLDTLLTPAPQCMPEVRTWPGQRCQGCIVSNQPCGPNELSERPPAVQSSPSRSTSLSFPPFPNSEANTNVLSFDSTAYTPDGGSSWGIDAAWIPNDNNIGSYRNRRPQNGITEVKKPRDVIRSK